MSVFEQNRPLLDAFRRGDRPALAAVYSRYVDEVAALVRRGFTMEAAKVSVPGVREPERQCDLTQEVFLRAFAERARLSYDGLSPFRPWLLRIGKNLMIDEGRRAGRLVGLKDLGPDLRPSESDALLPLAAEEELEWKTLRESTRAWCAGLDPQLQRFVVLRFEEDHSQADVADALGVSRRQARKMEDLVRTRLRRHLTAIGLIS